MVDDIGIIGKNSKSGAAVFMEASLFTVSSETVSPVGLE